MSPELKTKIQTLFNSLNQGLVERESILKMALLTVLAGENLLLIGPPGTAKSLIARRIAQILTADDNSSDYFEYLLTKFSTPEEIFGPLSIAALKADCVKRNTTGYLPTVRIAFLDEIFKASSSILNALLTILNERKYHNGAVVQDVPMQALIAASNELPTGQEELSALYDRFLVRVFVDYVSLDGLPQLFEKTPERANVTPFTIDVLEAIRKAANEVRTPPEIVQAIQQIWQKHRDMFKEDRREQLSDRRLKKVIKLVSVAAATNGRTEVNLSDVVLLKDCLWNHPDNAIKVREMIIGVLCDYSAKYKSSVIADVSKTVGSVMSQSIAAVAVSFSSSWWGSISTSHNATSQTNRIKGYKGSGTQTDPILISNYQEIASLERTDVGQKGYYFRQTADIDCSVLSTWPEIIFQGHYDGGGYSVIYKQQEELYQIKYLFSSIKQLSSVINLRVKTMLLAKSADHCAISACTAIENSLIQEAKNCNITACKAEQHLVANSANECVILQCQSGYPLIGDDAIKCHINDCIAVLNCARVKDRYEFGGVASVLTQSVVECCFVTGQLNYSYYNYKFAGIAYYSTSSSIRSCALGELQRDNSVSLSGLIICNTNDASTLQNNIAIDSHQTTSGSQGKYGKSVSAVLFNQHYFENDLDWDFDTVWQWNSTLNRPQLQSVGVGATVKTSTPTQVSTNDLLAQQISANIWL